MSKNNLLILTLFIGISGCSTTESNQEQTVADNNLVCEYIAKTGSNVKQRRCMTKQESERMRRENQEAMRKVNKVGRMGEKSDG